MKKKLFIAVVVTLGLIVLFSTIFQKESKKEPVVLASSMSFRQLSIDNKIKEAEVIVIGEVKTILPSRWNAPGGNDSKKASPNEVSQAGGLFTDSIITIDQILKGNVIEPVVRVRSYIGEIETVRWINKSQPSFVKKRTYLLFLEKDIGPTAKVDPGDYVSVNANTAVYEIVDGKAISADDEWKLDELIAYIQKFLSQTPTK